MHSIFYKGVSSIMTSKHIQFLGVYFPSGSATGRMQLPVMAIEMM